MMAIVYKILIALFLLISLPFQLLIGVFIAVSSGLPVLYCQKRVGKNGAVFTLYKFRTMGVGADKLQEKYVQYNEADGPVFKIRNDPRFTPVGKFLSHTGLDELPQLYNVLTGDMALFGPRPLPVKEEAKLKPWQKNRQSIKPGIISPWILEGYHTTSFVAWMKSDLAYAQKKSIWVDSILFMKTGLLFVRLFFRLLLPHSRLLFQSR